MAGSSARARTRSIFQATLQKLPHRRLDQVSVVLYVADMLRGAVKLCVDVQVGHLAQQTTSGHAQHNGAASVNILCKAVEISSFN